MLNHYDDWDPGTPNDLYDLLDWGNATFTTTMVNHGCNVLVLMSGFDDPNVGGLCIYENTVISVTNSPQANLLQHEESHFYDCDDNQCTAGSHCIMTYAYTYSHRDWCTDCTSHINGSKYRFG